jgi:hypothetical protein
MCFDRNINGNRDVKLECDYLFACATVRETHFRKFPFDPVVVISFKNAEKL